MNQKETLTRTELREKRLQELLDSCQDQIILQLIGPFGLTPAMFQDKDGGNVTTQFNANKGIYSKETEEFDRTDYDYRAVKRNKKSESIRNGNMNSQEFVDQYTGKLEPTKRENSAGKLVMNAELDHLIPVKEIHKQGGWMKDEDGRKELSSTPENLHYTTHATNRSKGADSPEEALSEKNGFDQDRIKPMTDTAREAVSEKQPNTTERILYHSQELVKAGAIDALTNAVRQALGVAFYEFITASFHELKILLMDKEAKQNLIERLIESSKRILKHVTSKISTILEALRQGAIQGICSTLLTFIINSMITTAAKVVTAIREGMRGLLKAMKLLISPPANMSSLEIARQVTKILAAVITTSFGLIFEESIKGFLATIPILLPLSETISPAVTAILIGIATALIVYGLDRFFDWLSQTGTELLQAMESNLDETKANLENMAQWLEIQFLTSKNYTLIKNEYKLIELEFLTTQEKQEEIMLSQEMRIIANGEFNKDLKIKLTSQNQKETEVMDMLEAYLAE